MKVIQILEVDSEGHHCRLADGRVYVTPHGTEAPSIGDDVPVGNAASDGSFAPSLDQLNSEEQVVANILSEAVKQE